MTVYYAAVKWAVDATKSDIARGLQNDLELLILSLVEEKGFAFDDVRRYFEDALDSVDTDLQESDDGNPSDVKP